ncbi:MAG TPA: cytochrome c [Candidatus Acidoferrales bacterium]|nr:cytochrome c [Candidatus Acidoferrales bacterium]
MKTILASAAIALFALAAAGASQQNPGPEKPADSHLPPGYTIPEKEVKRENPVKPTEASIAAGAKYYSSQCAMCHGKDGDGQGDLAQQMGLNMPDYRKAESLAPFTDGELFYILTNGMGKMVGEGERTPEHKKWDVINYMRSLAKPKEAEKPKP